MNVVDSSGWLEYFAAGSNAGFFAPAIRNTEQLLVPTVCLYEVFKRVLVQLSAEEALRAAGVMSLGEVIDLSRDIALSAAQLSVEHKLAMADSFILATARAHEAVLWTQDEHFKGLPDVRYVEKQPRAP
jgi:predicted nucleic acid-binding protein